MISLRARLLLAASVVLLAFIGLCGAGLEKAFHDSALAAQQQRMRGLVYALLGAATQNDDGALVLSVDDLPEPRLRQPGSGLEAALLDESGAVLWRSPSVIEALPVVIGPPVGDWKFERLQEDGSFVLSFGLRWIDESHLHRRYTALALDDPQAYEEQLGVFRRTLWLWLLVAAAGLLAALLLVQHWGLAPTRRLARELRHVETGERQQIETMYPKELAPLAAALNAMIRSERGQQARYRNALADLAHSLKTPLAVLRGLERPPQAGTYDEQLSRMREIVDHQLSKAAAAGRHTLRASVHVLPVVEKTVAALKKAHAEKPIEFHVAAPEALRLRVVEGDLYEIAGNLLDNAAKWCRGKVAVKAEQRGIRIHFQVADDGPGFPPEPERLLQRGVRGDSRVAGQGLGLAAVATIVDAYEGKIHLGRSAELGGAEVTIELHADL